MPKTYSEKEKILIKNKLKEAASECLASYGVKKTTVDELIKKVNIPKGTFYLFYASKELLLFDAINDLHNKIQEKFLEELSLLKDEITVERLTDFIFDFIKFVDNTYLLQIMTNGDMELLMRKLPDDVVREHILHDEKSMDLLKAVIPQARNKNMEYYSGVLRGVFLNLLHKREIGEEIFDEVMRLMIRGVVLQLMEE